MGGNDEPTPMKCTESYVAASFVVAAIESSEKLHQLW